MATLAETVSALHASPLWAASSGARELFHSDMVQWLAVNESNAFAQIFDLESTGAYLCHRERGHLDLWIESRQGGRSIVIENKLFSLPREDQLDGYSEKISKKYPSAGWKQLLLSLTRPNWSAGRYGPWSWMSYRTLGQRLVEGFADRTDFAGQFAGHWGELCLHLHDLAQAVAITDDQELYDLDSRRADLLDARLLAFAALLRAYQLADRIRTALDEPRVAIAVDFTRSKALVEAFSEVSPGFELGWQLQEHQWRLAARTREGAVYEGRPCWGRVKDDANQRITWVRNVFPDHFSFDELGSAGIVSAIAKTKAAFQHFAPGFTYRYRKVGDATVGQLVAAGVATSRRVLRHDARCT